MFTGKGGVQVKNIPGVGQGKPEQAITVLEALATSKSLDAVCVGKSWDILNWLPQAVTTARIE